MVAAPPLIEKLKGSPTSWVLFAAACLQTFNCALGVWLTKVTTVSVPPAGARKTAVPVLVSIDTFLPVGERVIDWTTVVPVAASATVTWPPATLNGPLHCPPSTLTLPPAPVLSV